MLSNLYWGATPDHKRPRRDTSANAGNRPIRGMDRYTGPRYALSEDCTTEAARRLKRVEAARREGAVVRLVGDVWHINGVAAV